MSSTDSPVAFIDEREDILLIFGFVIARGREWERCEVFEVLWEAPVNDKYTANLIAELTLCHESSWRAMYSEHKRADSCPLKLAEGEIALVPSVVAPLATGLNYRH